MVAPPGTVPAGAGPSRATGALPPPTYVGGHGLLAPLGRGGRRRGGADRDPPGGRAAVGTVEPDDRPGAVDRDPGVRPGRVLRLRRGRRWAGVAADQPVLRVGRPRSEEHTSELQSRVDLVCRL